MQRKSRKQMIRPAASEAELPRSRMPWRPKISKRPLSNGARHQQGAVTLEFAWLFALVFFPLLYSIIAFGLTFLVRESMQYAVEEAVRESLRVPPPDMLQGARQVTWTHREAQARQVLTDAMFWVPEQLMPSSDAVHFTACPLQDESCANPTPGAELPTLSPALQCSPDTPCLIRLRFDIDDYPRRAIAPPLPGMGLFYPDALSAEAQILMSRSLL